MSNGTPSMTALLGLLAIAGYQNKDKIAEWFGGLSGSQPAPAGGPAGAAPPSGLDGILGPMRQSAGSAGAGGFLGGGLKELVDKFKQAGQGPTVDSWVNHGPNQEIAPPSLESAIGPDTMNSLTQQTGLSREEILARLSRELPRAIDRYTPDGRLPA